METQDLEKAMKLLRTAKMLQLSADGASPIDTTREYQLLATAATWEALSKALVSLACQATDAAAEADRRAAAAAAERKEAKRQAN